MVTDGVKPALSPLGIKVMSMDLFLKDDETPVLWESQTQKDAFTWRGTMEMSALREFLSDTEWGTLDYLLIDLPPAQTDCQISSISCRILAAQLWSQSLLGCRSLSSKNR